MRISDWSSDVCSSDLIADDSLHLRHGGEHGGIGLRRTSGDKNAGFGSGAVRAPDRLAGLAHGFIGDSAAIDDDEIVLPAGQCPHGFAFGDVEAAAQRDDFGTAHPKRLQSASPSKTEVAGPVMRIDPPGVQPMSRSPPGRRSEEHTSELQSIMSHSYAVLC